MKFQTLSHRIWKTFFANLDLKVLSFLLAVLLWHYTASQNPRESRKFNVPVLVKNLSLDYALLNPEQAVVSVIAEGTIDVLNRVNPADILLSADAERALPPVKGEGIYEFPVEADSLPFGLTLRNYPPTVRLEIGKTTEKELEVEFNLLGALPQNVEIQQLSIEPSRVRILGAASEIAKAEKAVVNFLPSHFEKESIIRKPVQVVDRDGNVLEGLAISPPDVRIWISFAITSAKKYGVVKPRVLGLPAPGYYIEAIRVEPQMVLLTGAPEKLPAEPIVETLPIDINQTTRTVKKTRLPLVFPENRFQVSPSEVSVSVEIRPINGETVLEIPVEVSPPEGWQASVVPATVSVTLFGPLPEFKKLRAGAVRALAPVRSTEELSFATRLQVIYPEQFQLIRLFPEEVTVKLSRAASQ